MGVVAVCLVVGLGVGLAAASAAPRHDSGLTINAVPDPIEAGQGVLIYGFLRAPARAGETIRLYHRIGAQPAFTLIGTTRTSATGAFEFTRAEGVVLTNRRWYVLGPGGTHSRTVSERVAALIDAAAGAPTASTGQPIVLSGSITPAHPDGSVLLQEAGPSGGWRTLGSAPVAAGSRYSIAHGWAVPGAYDVRVMLPANARNITSESDTVTVVIQQREVADFTIATSAPIVTNGQAATISGTLYEAGTTTPSPATAVALWARPAGGSFGLVANSTTAGDGSFAFSQVPTADTDYQVRTAFAPVRRSAVLFEGVRDAVTMRPSSTTSTVGGTVTLGGTVTPDEAGQSILLQQLAADGQWHSVATSVVNASSTYQFAWTFGKVGDDQFRARVASGGARLGAVSPPVTVAVSGLAPVTSLPPAS